MGKQYYSGSKERETIYWRPTKDVSQWLRQISFKQGKSLNMILTEHFEHLKAEYERDQVNVESLNFG